MSRVHFAFVFRYRGLLHVCRCFILEERCRLLCTAKCEIQHSIMSAEYILLICRILS